MTTQLVGYKLRNISTNEIIETWGGSWGQCPNVPGEIRLPSGDIVCAPSLGEDYQGCVLELWNMEEPIIIPQTISDRQFFQQAAIIGIITQQEALDAVSIGAIPTVLQNIVNGIQDTDQQFAAKMLLSGATVFERNHPLVDNIGLALNWTSDQIDHFFFEASKL